MVSKEKGGKGALKSALWIACLLLPAKAPAPPPVEAFPECDFAWERLDIAAEQVRTVTEDPVIQQRWIRRGLRALVNLMVLPRANQILEKPLGEVTPEEAVWLRKAGTQLSDSHELAEINVAKRIASRVSQLDQRDAFRSAPLEVLPHDNRAAKSWRTLTKNAQEKAGIALEELNANPSLGETKVSFPKNIRFYKFFNQHVVYIVAYEVRDKQLYIHAIGSHENFYNRVSYLRH